MSGHDDDLVVDQLGVRCPLPVIELARRIVEVPVGGVVRLRTDDPAAANDVPAWCAMRGHTCLGRDDSDGPAYRVRREA